MALPTSGRTATIGDADVLYGGIMIPEGEHDLLISTALAHIATIGSRGEPQSTPVWFGWDGEYIRFSQTKRQQKYRNLRHDPRIALSMVDPRNPYRYLEVRGVVVAFEDDPDRAFVDSFSLYFVFSLYERKSEIQSEYKVPPIRFEGGRVPA
jgi:PPOX class probable F420-dependent enzyme